MLNLIYLYNVLNIERLQLRLENTIFLTKIVFFLQGAGGKKGFTINPIEILEGFVSGQSQPPDTILLPERLALVAI